MRQRAAEVVLLDLEHAGAVTRAKLRKRASLCGPLARLRKRGAPIGFVGIFALLTQAFAPALAFASSPEQMADASIAGAVPITSAPASRFDTGDKPDPGSTPAAGARSLTPEEIEALGLHGSQAAAGEAADARRSSPEIAGARAVENAGNPASVAGANGPANKVTAPVVATAAVGPAAASDKTGASSQAIHAPQGPGTLEGMGESFSTQLSTGVATFSVPFALPAARGAAQPSLSLSYSSASGWGVAGLGWDIGVPFIARQTDRGVPHYGDQADFYLDQDRFVFNGGQELVPICTVTGSASNLACVGALAGEAMPPWSLGSQYFRARVEGSFLRFFWSADHLTWRVQDKSGITLELGMPLDGSGDTSGLEANPDNPAQVFRWDLVRQYDTQGTANPASANTAPTPNNLVVYRYLVDGNASFLSDVYDTPPVAALSTKDLSRFAHHARLVYETRSDPVVSYRSGWKVERELRLSRVDVSSKTFNYGDAQKRRLLRRYHLAYSPTQHVSLLTGVQVEGRCAASETSAALEDLSGAIPSSSCQLLPAMTFDYTHVLPFTTAGAASSADLSGYEGFDERIRTIPSSPPHSLDEELADLFDLNGDALPDLLVTAPGLYGSGFGAFYNAPAGAFDTFGAATNLSVQGVLGANADTLKLSNPNVAVLDVDGDGRIDLLHMPLAKDYAVYSFSGGGLVGRAVTTASQQSPRLDFGRDALTTRVMDVNADGLVDVVVTAGTEIQTYFSLGRYPGAKDQFGSAVRTGVTTSSVSNDPVRSCLPTSGSPVDFGSSEIQLGDFNGDGLQDIIRLQPGAIRYWPGRGNGYWARETRGPAPRELSGPAATSPWRTVPRFQTPARAACALMT